MCVLPGIHDLFFTNFPSGVDGRSQSRAGDAVRLPGKLALPKLPARLLDALSPDVLDMRSAKEAPIGGGKGSRSLSSIPGGKEAFPWDPEPGVNEGESSYCDVKDGGRGTVSSTFRLVTPGGWPRVKLSTGPFSAGLPSLATEDM